MNDLLSVSTLFIDGDWIETKDQSESGIRLIQVGNIGIGKYIDKADKAKYISKETFEHLKCTEVKEGDILISRLPDPIGRACIVPKLDTKCITAVDCSIVRLDEEKCNKEYFVHYTCSDIYNLRLSSFFSGSTRTRISRKNLEKTFIPLPPLETQRKIAATLDKVTHTIELCNAILEKLDLLVKARFVEMFGEPITNPKGWKMVDLGELTSVGSSKRIFEKEYVESGIPFYRTKEIVELSKGNPITTELFISEKRYAEIKKQYGVPKKGDLLISAVGTIGVIWIVDGENDFYYKDGNLIRVDGTNRFNSSYMKWLLEYLIAEYKKQMSAGTAYAALTISGLSKMQVYDVPIDLQQQFAAFVAQTDKSKVAVQNVLEKAEILKKALMQEYFG